jgi:hypothetical protein
VVGCSNAAAAREEVAQVPALALARGLCGVTHLIHGPRGERVRSRRLARAGGEPGGHAPVPRLAVLKEISQIELEIDERVVHVVDVHEQTIRRARY